MTKQPKYFYSKDKPLKTIGSIVDGEAPVASPVRSKFILPGHLVSRFGQQALFGAAILTLVGLSAMGILPVVKARQSLLPLPSIFPSSQGQSTVISQPGPVQASGLTFDVQVADARVEIVKNFLQRHNSPLTPPEYYAKELVAASDRYGVDYRLLPAIMMQESNLCKMSKPELKNCFGFGIHKRGELGFDTYEASFDRVAKELKERYIDIGLVTPDQIMKKYTPSSTTWANSVNQWIAEMEYNDRDKGKANEADANLLEYVSPQ